MLPGTFRVQKLLNEPIFHLLARPGGFSQKCETGLYRRIQLKAAYGNTPSHLFPSVPPDELIKDVLQRDTMQRIAGMRGLHEKSISSNPPCRLRKSPRFSSRGPAGDYQTTGSAPHGCGRCLWLLFFRFLDFLFLIHSFAHNNNLLLVVELQPRFSGRNLQ